MRRLSLVFLVLLLTSTVVSAVTVKKIIVEATYEVDRSIIKFRLFDYTLPSETQRIDIMLGRKFRALTLYGHWKFDNKDRSWVGIRVDCDKNILKGKLRGNLSLRYFYGLNKKTRDELYFISSLDYEISRLRWGVMTYGKKSMGEDPFIYICPSVSTKLTKHISVLIAYGRDILNESKMIYWKTNFKF